MINYSPLFKKLIDENMTKTQFREELGISTATLARMSKGQSISLSTIKKICEYFNCDVNDIISCK